MNIIHKLLLAFILIISFFIVSGANAKDWNQNNEIPVVTPIKEWRIDFNTNMSSLTTNRQNIYVLDANKQFIKTQTILQNGNTVVVTKPGGYESGIYTMHITRDVKSDRNIPLEEEVLFTFKVEGTPEDYIEDRLTLGTSYEEVVKIMGEPDKNNYFGRLVYGQSIIYLDTHTTSTVVGWENFGDLRLQDTKPNPDAPLITIGSSMEEVIIRMGTPTSVFSDTQKTTTGFKVTSRTYRFNGGLTVYTDSSNQVISWQDLGSLDVFLGEKDPHADPFFLGSTVEDVLSAMGTPNGIIEHSNWMRYSYGSLSSVDFDMVSMKVKSYDNTGGFLKLQQPTSIEGSAFTLGSSKEEVFSVMGTPDIANNEIWDYGTSRVMFASNQVKGWLTNSVPLKTSMGDAELFAPPIQLGSTVQDVILAMGTPKNVFSSADNYEFNYGSNSNISITNNKVDKIVNYGGDIKVTNAKKEDEFLGFWIDSSKDEVVKASGVPYVIEFRNGLETWEYRNSTVSFQDEKVVYYANNGELNVVSYPKHTNTTLTFSLYSSKEEVLNVMGTPDYYGSDRFTYGESTVFFNDESQVIKWSNNGNLKISKINISEDKPPIQLGLTTDEVKATMGEPTLIDPKAAYGLRYYYGNSYVVFDSEGRVNMIENTDSNLKLSYAKDPTFDLIWVGASQEEVLHAFGDPTSIVTSKPGNLEYRLTQYFYPNGFTLWFDKENRVSYYHSTNQEMSLRRITAGIKEPSASSFTVGSTKADLVAVMGSPRSIVPIQMNGEIYESWHYPHYSWVTLDPNGRVYNYDNNSNTLDVQYGVIVEGALPFTIGSTKNEVQAVMGTPSAVFHNIDGRSRWEYDDPYNTSTVYFDVNDKVSNYYNRGILKVQ